MNLRQLAEKDLAFTLEDSLFGGGVEMKFAGGGHPGRVVVGSVGDTGFSFDSEGNPIAARTVQVSWRLSAMSDESGKYIVPGRGWTCEWSDLSGRKWKAFVAKVEPDRTIGIGRALLAFDLGLEEEGESEGDDSGEALALWRAT